MCPSCPTPSPADRTTLGPSSVFHTVPDVGSNWTWGSNVSCEPQVGYNKLEQVGCWCFHGKSRVSPPNATPFPRNKASLRGLVLLDFHDVSMIFEEQKTHLQVRLFLMVMIANLRFWSLFASQGTSILCKFICWKMFQHVFFT